MIPAEAVEAALRIGGAFLLMILTALVMFALVGVGISAMQKMARK